MALCTSYRGYLLCLKVNTKYVSLSVLKTSEFSRVRITSENFVFPPHQMKIFDIYINKSVFFFFFILYYTWTFSHFPIEEEGPPQKKKKKKKKKKLELSEDLTKAPLLSFLLE